MGSGARPPTALTAAGSMPGQVVLAAAVPAGATSVKLNVFVITTALGWLMIDPYGPQCELRQISGEWKRMMPWVGFRRNRFSRRTSSASTLMA